MEFETSMIRSNLCDYIDGYIVVSETIAITGARADERNKGVIFKNSAQFTEYISETYNAQIVNAKEIDVVVPMYNLIEYSNNYSKTSGSLWQYYKDDPNDNLVKSKIRITENTPNNDNLKKC